MAENNQNNAPAPAKGGAVAQAPKKVDILKSMFKAESVKEQFQNALAKNAPTFIASVIDLYNSDSNLQLCDPKAIVMEALKAAVLHLPINKALGYAYIIPYNNSYTEKDEYGRDVLDANGKKKWYKKMEPTFQMGYKGYIQLAMRTGQYRTLNADVVYEGEVRNRFFSCQAGVSVGSVMADGSIAACASIRADYNQGNIYEDDFMDVWENRYQKYRNREWMKKDDCASCSYFRYCQGNGMHLRDGNGKLLFCHLKRLKEI